MLKTLLIGLGIYILYRFIVNFLLPLAGVARQMNRKMNEFREQQQQMYEQPPQRSQSPTPHTAPRGAREDYLDFEELK
jgi:hypothetical protein